MDSDTESKEIKCGPSNQRVRWQSALFLLYKAKKCGPSNQRVRWQSALFLLYKAKKCGPSNQGLDGKQFFLCL